MKAITPLIKGRYHFEYRLLKVFNLVLKVNVSVKLNNILIQGNLALCLPPLVSHHLLFYLPYCRHLQLSAQWHQRCCPGRDLFMLGSPCKGLPSVLHCEGCLLCLSACGLNVCPSTLCIDSRCQLLHCSLLNSCAELPLSTMCLSTYSSPPIWNEQMKG